MAKSKAGVGVQYADDTPDTPGPTTAPPVWRLKVRALQVGYYEHIRRRVGDVFSIERPQDFSAVWMQEVGASTPERITTGTQALRQMHDETMRDRAPSLITPGDDRDLDVLGTPS